MKLIDILFFISFFVFACTKEEMSSSLGKLTYTSPVSKNAKWEKFPIVLCMASKLPKNFRKPLEEATKVWEDFFKIDFFNLECNLKIDKYTELNTETHGIYWLKKDFEKLTAKTSFARTVLHFENSGKILDADIILNGQYYDWDKTNVDIKTIFIHELGHVLGLKHFFLNTDSSMNYYPYITGYKHHDIGTYEKIVIENLYKNKKSNVPTYMYNYFEGNYMAAIKSLKSQKRGFQEEYALGMLLKLVKNYDEASKAFEKALTIKSNVVMAQYNLAGSLWNSGKEKIAREKFSNLVKNHPYHYESITNLSVIYINEGNLKQASALLKRVLEIQPMHWPACKLLFEISREKKYQVCFEQYRPLN